MVTTLTELLVYLLKVPKNYKLNLPQNYNSPSNKV